VKRAVRYGVMIVLLLVATGTAMFVYLPHPNDVPDRVMSYLEERKNETRPLVLKSAGDWITLQPGLELRRARFNRKDRLLSRFNLIALRVDPEKMRLRMIHVPAKQLPQTDIETLAQSTGAIALINASYFEPDFKVMGLLVCDEQRISPMRKEGNIHHGVFYLHDNRAFLEHRTNFSEPKVEQAFQACPWLISDGEAQHRFRNANIGTRRSAVGVDKKGRVILAATDALLGGLSLPELAGFLAKPESEGGFALWRAINCDGGTSTQMLLNHPRESLTIRSTMRVPAYLGVFAR